jgi:hypothetical protein
MCFSADILRIRALHSLGSVEMNSSVRLRVFPLFSYWDLLIELFVDYSRSPFCPFLRLNGTELCALCTLITGPRLLYALLKKVENTFYTCSVVFTVNGFES